MAEIVRGLLAAVLKERQQEVHNQLLGWAPEDLLGQPADDVVELLKSVALVECPVLDRAAGYMLEPEETVRKVHVYVDAVDRVATVFTLVVPFSGDAQVFHLQTSTYTLCPPEVQVCSGQLRLTYITDGVHEPVEEEIRKAFDSQLDEVDRLLDFARNDIRVFLRQIEQQLPTWVAQRRAKLAGGSEAQRQHRLPGPTQGRRRHLRGADPPYHRARPHGPPPDGRASSFVPEPTMDVEAYEAALTVLLNMRNALERSPSTTAKLSEEGIRNLLLVSLNAQWG